MPVHLYAGQGHYQAHLWPIWEALPEEVRGVAWSPRRGDPWSMRRRPTDLSDPVLVTGVTDIQAVTPHPVILVEHGAGQSYAGDPTSAHNPSYSGGSGRERVVLHVVPNETVAARCRAAQPEVPVAVVGCPKLDRFHAGTVDDGGSARPSEGPAVTARRVGTLHNVASWRTQRGGDGRSSPQSGPTVAVTFHWNLPMVPETLSAWPHYDRALPVLAEHYDILGHGHPRLWGRIERRWRQLGIPSTPSFDRVLETADVLVADNTSAMWEAASLDIPLVVLDVPWYRRNVNHGLRFWTHADAGVRIAEPEELVDAVAEALADRPQVVERRQQAVDEVYAYRDGRAAARAAEAVLQLLRARR